MTGPIAPDQTLFTSYEDFIEAASKTLGEWTREQRRLQRAADAKRRLEIGINSDETKPAHAARDRLDHAAPRFATMDPAR